MLLKKQQDLTWKVEANKIEANIPCKATGDHIRLTVNELHLKVMNEALQMSYFGNNYTKFRHPT